MDLGRVWEVFWEGLGKDLGRFGWILRGLRAIWALWGLFARFCMYVQAFYAILHILDQSSQAKPCFTFSSFRLHASTAQIIFRSSRSLLRQVSQVGSCWHFFGSFFQVFFLTSFLQVFSSILEGFGGQNCSQNRFLERFLGCFLGTLILERFCINFYAIF